MGSDDLYHFFASGDLYSIDNYWNVYSQDGTLVYNGSDEMDAGGRALSFDIGGMPYTFDTNGLSIVGEDCDPLAVQLWSGPLDNLNAPTLGKRSRDDSETSGPAKLGNATYRETKSRPREKHFFCASNRLYYFDGQRRLFTHDDKLVYNGSSGPLMNRTSIPSFQIDGVPYWLGLDGLSTREADGTHDRVYTWSNKSDPFNQHPRPNQGSISQIHSTIPTPKPISGFYPTPASDSTTLPNLDTRCSTPNAEDESCPPNATSQSLVRTLLGKNMVAMSPTFSIISSPGSQSPTSGHSEADELPLFPATELSKALSLPIAPLQPTNIESQNIAASPQPVARRGKAHKTCKLCGKEFRRPSSLEEHMNHHNGLKPHMCPFNQCKIGFATKSNMRRHFETHKAGRMDEYKPGVAQQPGGNKRARVEEPVLDNRELSQVAQIPSNDLGYGGTDAQPQSHLAKQVNVTGPETTNGAELHVCPFEGCSIRLSTRSFMRRHFGTHRSGDLDDYEPGITHQPGGNIRARVEKPVPENQDVPENQELALIEQFRLWNGLGSGGTDEQPRSRRTTLFDLPALDTANAPPLLDDLNNYVDERPFSPVKDWLGLLP